MGSDALSIQDMLDAPARVIFAGPNPDDDTCPLCGGKGWFYSYIAMHPDGSHEMGHTSICMGCNGKGEIPGCRRPKAMRI